MNKGRGVVAGILPSERMADRFAQIPFAVALADALFDGCLQLTVTNYHFLAELDKDYRQPGVLADGRPFLPCDPRVFLQATQDFPAHRGSLFGPVVFKSLDHVFTQIEVGLYGGLLDSRSDSWSRDLAHKHPPFVV